MNHHDDILARIDNYLQNGGLFNPEMMHHGKVGKLILDCRDTIRKLKGRLKEIEDFDLSYDFTDIEDKDRRLAQLTEGYKIAVHNFHVTNKAYVELDKRLRETERIFREAWEAVDRLKQKPNQNDH